MRFGRARKTVCAKSCWMAIVGMYPLRLGLNTVGSTDDCDEVRAKLVDLVARFGSELASDSTRCRALLSDVCGANYRREVNVLVAAVTERSACELAINNSLLPREVFFSRLAARLHDNLGITEDLAHWSIESWAIALTHTPRNRLHRLPPAYRAPMRRTASIWHCRAVPQCTSDENAGCHRP